MSQTLTSIRELLARYTRTNGSGSIKAANAMIPELAELIIAYVDEATDSTIVQRVLDAPARSGKTFLVEPVISPVRSRPSVVADVTDNTDAQVTQILNEHNAKVQAAAIDMNNLNDDEQQAYIEAQRRVQNLTNNGARYMGEESLVEAFVAKITAKPAAAPCAPCEVNEDGTSAIIDALVAEADKKAEAAAISEVLKPADKKAPARKAPKK